MRKAELWVVYERPPEEPMHFVAYRYEILGNGRYERTEDKVLDADLERLRSRLQNDKGMLSRLPRHPNDGQHVLETWMN